MSAYKTPPNESHVVESLFNRYGKIQAAGGNLSLDGEIFGSVSMYGRSGTAGIILASMRVFPSYQRRGLARQFLRQLCATADAQQWEIYLTPDPIGKGGASKTSLTKLYREFGFVTNRGKSQDYRFLETMRRMPSSHSVIGDMVGALFDAGILLPEDPFFPSQIWVFGISRHYARLMICELVEKIAIPLYIRQSTNARRRSAAPLQAAVNMGRRMADFRDAPDYSKVKDELENLIRRNQDDVPENRISIYALRAATYCVHRPEDILAVGSYLKYLMEGILYEAEMRRPSNDPRSISIEAEKRMEPTYEICRKFIRLNFHEAEQLAAEGGYPVLSSGMEAKESDDDARALVLSTLIRHNMISMVKVIEGENPSQAIREKTSMATSAMLEVRDARTYVSSIRRTPGFWRKDDNAPQMMSWQVILNHSDCGHWWPAEAVRKLRATQTLKGVVSGVGGREWHESQEYFGGGEELTRTAASKALLAPEKDEKTLKRLLLSVNAAPDVVYAILKSDPEIFSYLLKQHPRLTDLVLEEPKILSVVTDGVFERLVTEAVDGRVRDSLLGKPVATLRFSKLLRKLRASGSDARELGRVWPISLELFASGALCRESQFDEDDDNFRYWKDWGDGLDHTLMEIRGNSYFYDNMKDISRFLVDKENALEEVTPREIWDLLAKYSDTPKVKGPVLK